MEITEEQRDRVVSGLRCLAKARCGPECVGCDYRIPGQAKEIGFCDSYVLMEDLVLLMQDLRREG